MDILSQDFQTDLLCVVLQDASFLQKHRDILDPELFKDKLEREIAQHAITFYDRYGSSPAERSFVQYLDQNGYEEESAKESVSEFYRRNVTGIDFIEESLRDFVRGSRLRDAMRDAVTMLENRQYDELVSVINKASLSVDHGNIGESLWHDRKKVIAALDLTEPFIPTGFTDLDAKMSGGAVRGTLNVVITPPNRGKSTSLVNLGKSAAIRGFKVVHYTFELAEQLIERRYFMSMARMSKVEMREKKRTAYDRIIEYADRVTEESVVVKGYPAHTATTDTIRAHLQTMRNQLGFLPDLILVDYADLMRSKEHYEQKRHELANIYYDLRNVAKETNAAMWTASQTNRTGTSEELITDADLAECFEKAAAADVMVSINQTLDERRARPQTARVFLAKNRDDESQIVVEIQTDWSRAWMGDL